jgi:hypothetical protein
MADTTTTTYGLTKPEVGASEDTWGAKGNTNLDTLDDILDGTITAQGMKLDDNLSIVDNSDATKVLKFQVSGIATATTRTATWPDFSGVVSMTGGTETLTNKTLTSPTINGATIGSSTLNSPTINTPTMNLAAITSSGDLPIADGGTGAGTASAAFTALKQASTTSATGVVEKATTAEAEAGTAADKFPDVVGVKAAIEALSPFSLEFTSTGQTITSAGSLVLAHGLAVIPKLIQSYLKCTSAENGYSIGDEVVQWLSHRDAATVSAPRGFSLVIDDTNLNIRFGDATKAFSVINKSDGSAADLTNSSWELYVRAWA